MYVEEVLVRERDKLAVVIVVALKRRNVVKEKEEEKGRMKVVNRLDEWK